MKKGSITYELRRQIMVPLIFLSISVLLITGLMLYHSVKTETRDGLANLAHSVLKICSLQGDGEYTLENGVLMKGGEVFDESNSIVNDVFYISGVDTTIFFKDKRVLTSIRTPSGDRAVGTQASDVVKEKVLLNGEEYFSELVNVNGSPYFGYYIPLRNSDETIAGMVFVGKSWHMILKAILKTTSCILVVILIVAVITLGISFRYSSQIIYSLHKIKEFLEKVAAGDIKTKINQDLLNRTDEIGEMGRFAEMLQKNITELVGTDVLTGLYNRRSGRLFLENAQREQEQYNIPFGIVLADIDNFKLINDTYGHAAGDEVLKKLAGMLKEHMNKKGIAVRWGGEEFLLIYERMQKEAIIEYTEQLREQICRTVILYDDIEMAVTLTFGVLEGIEGMSTEGLLNGADEKLYCGKRNGKNCIN